MCDEGKATPSLQLNSGTLRHLKYLASRPKQVTAEVLLKVSQG